MSNLIFSGRVAVVTGAGRGLGKSYACLLAKLGAKVVVNDPGVSIRGESEQQDAADQVVEEIKAFGGVAVANKDSVATSAGGQSIIDTAISHFGGIDILVHNAGIVRRASILEMTDSDIDQVLDVHLKGGFNVLRPAFKHMAAQNYGRIVFAGSINGLYGHVNAANYSAAKGGIHALSCVTAIEGEQYNIKSNVILPAAITRMAEGVDTSSFPEMPPDTVAPAVAWLAHEKCSLTGDLLVSAAGRIARAYPVETPGVSLAEWTLDSVDQHMPEIAYNDNPIAIKAVPNGFADHLGYSFKAAATRS